MKNQTHEVGISSQCYKDEKEKYLYQKPKLGIINLFADKVLNAPCSSFDAGCELPPNPSRN